ALPRRDLACDQETGSARCEISAHTIGQKSQVHWNRSFSARHQAIAARNASPLLSRLLGSLRAPLNEFLNRDRQNARLLRTPTAQLVGHVLRNVARPSPLV